MLKYCFDLVIGNCHHTRGGTLESLLITPENERVWLYYLSKVISGLVTPEAKETPEFQHFAEMVAEENKREERERIRQEKAPHRRQLHVERIDFVPDVPNSEVESAYEQILLDQVSWIPDDQEDFLFQLRHLERWRKKSIPALRAKGNDAAAEALSAALENILPLFVNRDDIREWLTKYKRRIKSLK